MANDKTRKFSSIIEDGDSITIDARLSKWQAPAPKETRGVLAKFAKLACSASEGVVTDKF